MQTFKGRDLLTLAELTPGELAHVLDVAETPAESWPRFDGASAGMIFMKPSLRTRVSFEVGCVQLGVHPIVMGPFDAFSREETVHDTVKVLERYVDLIVLRTFAHSHIEEVAGHASVPVINALTDDYHPCQGLADLLTIRQHKGALKGLRLAYVGDGANNMSNTYLLAGALAGMQVAIGAPAAYQPAPAVLAQAQELAARYGTGATFAVTADAAEAVAGADVVVTDTWASMGHEEEHAKRVVEFAGYSVTPELMAKADAQAIFMHCLPAHRGEEVANEVIDSAASVVFDEAENRLHAQRAWMSLVLGGEEL
ncbi:MAG: ornithine carbamoyltransferase [Actinobacteria bacterium]|nr:ornithine carbamoyltransferase [Actinomycetota bacterium]